MNFQESIVICFKKYVDFTGRAGRPEFWWFVLFGIICIVVATVISPLLGNLVSLGLLLPNLAVGARRLHDINRTGWWQLICLVPLIGLILIYFFALPGDKVSNQYGAPVA